MQPVIKQADIQKDSQILYSFEEKCFNRYFDNVFQNIQELKEYFGKVTVYIAKVNKKAVGYIGYKKKGGNTIEIVALAVLPKYQRKGLASALFGKLLEIEKGKTLSLVVHPENSGAVIFYLKQKFLIKGWLDNYFNDNQPRILMVRK
jgi:ribosomal protein S18 acetylase RimI-like enzyme